MDEYLLRFDLFRRYEESEMQMRGVIAEVSSSVLRIGNGSLSHSVKSLVLVSVEGNSEISGVAERCVVYPGHAGRCLTVCFGGDGYDEDDFAKWAAYRKANRKGEKEEADDGGSKTEKDRVGGGSQTPNNINKSTGLRNKCVWRDSEYHLFPKCPLKNKPKGDSAPLSASSRRCYRPP